MKKLLVLAAVLVMASFANAASYTATSPAPFQILITFTDPVPQRSLDVIIDYTPLVAAGINPNWATLTPINVAIARLFVYHVNPDGADVYDLTMDNTIQQQPWTNPTELVLLDLNGTAPNVGYFPVTLNCLDSYLNVIGTVTVLISSMPPIALFFPADGASCVDPNIILSWHPVVEGLSHDVYFGTNYSEVYNADINDANVYMGNQDVNSWNPGILNAAIYYWRIDEISFYGTTKGNIWSFATISPNKATNPVTANGASCVDQNVILRWQPGAGALSHDIYFGMVYNEVNNANVNDTNVFMGNQDVNNFNPGSLDAGTAYYWRIDEIGFYGTTKGNTWGFTTSHSPGKATNPVPADDANNPYQYTTVLNWTACDCAVSHDVYFGTTNPPPFKVNQTGTSYATGTMVQANYYWRIDEKNAFGTTTGDIWSFFISDCMKSTGQGYTNWVNAGKTNCWCYMWQRMGDVDGKEESIGMGIRRIGSVDLAVFSAAFGKKRAALTGNQICADLDHLDQGSGLTRKAIGSVDLAILAANYGKKTSYLPNPPPYAGDYNYWITPP